VEFGTKCLGLSGAVTNFCHDDGFRFRNKESEAEKAMKVWR